ncbi:TPA: hypothetical protein HA344_07010 [Candidatus Bathyarchaeota archaeon]|nr:hypothetical protein [Candidatus Bathyarchaeota archaeon]
MKTKMMFGLLAVLVAAVAVSTIALPALASSVEDPSNSTEPSILDASPVQEQVQNTMRTRQRLMVCDDTGVCSENCTQTRAQIRAMNGSCGVGDGTCTGEGSQYHGGVSAQGGQGVSGQTRSRGRNQTGSCVAAPTG